jgi:hypothetical protein
MSQTTRHITATIAAGLWINASEFFRNEVLLKSHWTQHYQSLGLSFPSSPVNGMVWILWGFVFAAMVYQISRTCSLARTALLAWMMGFVLMWLVIGNLGVLPIAILSYAIPLSLLECFIAAYLCLKLAPK